jgi:hypothetical protein
VHQQVFQANRLRSQNEDGYLPPAWMLFICKTAIDGQQHIELGGFRGGKKITVC